MNDDRYLDTLCQHTTKPHVLNALHACRTNHPLGRGNDYKWRNAYALVRQNTTDFLHADLRQLAQRANTEQGP